MSRATKKKYVAQEVLHELVIPEPPEQIAKVTGSRGNNLHDVTIPNGTTFLVSMPTKFRRSVWVKRGDFVVVTPIEEGDKVKAEISRILYHDQIRYIRSNNKWPPEFDDAVARGADWRDSKAQTSDDEDGSDSSGESSDDPVIKNPNRGIIRAGLEPSSSSSDSDSEGDAEAACTEGNTPEVAAQD